MKNILIIAGLFLLSNQLFSQDGLDDGSFYLGAKLGVNRTSNITNTASTIIPDRFDKALYNITEFKETYNFTGGVSAIYELGKNSKRDDFGFMSLNSDLMFSNLSGGYHYDELDFSNLEYDLLFDFNYLTFSFGIKGQIGGFYIKPGIGVSLNLSPERIEYSHNLTEIHGPSEYIEQELRHFIRGQHFFSYNIGIGYENTLNDSSGWGIELRYIRNLDDLIDVSANPYEWSSIPVNDISNLELSFYYLLKTNR